MLRWSARLTLALSTLCVSYVLAALIGAVWPLGPRADPTIARPIEVQLIAGPIHYDFLLPLTPDTRATFAFLHQDGLKIQDPSAEWLMVGWGAQGFYTTAGRYQDISATALFRAITGDTSVLRVDVFGRLPPSLPTLRLRLSTVEYAAFLEAIIASFKPNAQGNLSALNIPGLTGGDRFYPAQGRFNLFRTCNTWIGAMIRASGRRFGAWTPLPTSVTLAYKRLSEP